MKSIIFLNFIIFQCEVVSDVNQLFARFESNAISIHERLIALIMLTLVRAYYACVFHVCMHMEWDKKRWYTIMLKTRPMGIIM